jgi:hypothetical protein
MSMSNFDEDYDPYEDFDEMAEDNYDFVEPRTVDGVDMFYGIFHRMAGRRNRLTVWDEFLDFVSYNLAQAAGVKERKSKQLEKIEKKVSGIDQHLMNMLFELLFEIYKKEGAWDVLTIVADRCGILTPEQKHKYLYNRNCSNYAEGILAMYRNMFREASPNKHSELYEVVRLRGCGAGAPILQAVELLLEEGPNFSSHIMFHLIAPDSIAAKMCYIQLSLLKCCATVSTETQYKAYGKNPVGELHAPKGAFCTNAFYDSVWSQRRLEGILEQLKMENQSN